MNEFRLANAEDAGFIIPLVAESSGGVWPAIWKAYALDRESIEASGIRYLSNTENNLSIRNTVLAESSGSPIGILIRYREKVRDPGKLADSNSSSLPAELLTALQPFRQLSDPDSLFISELCLLPESRGKGVGTQFLQLASETAVDMGLPRVTLRVFSKTQALYDCTNDPGFRLSKSVQWLLIPISG